MEGSVQSEARGGVLANEDAAGGGFNHRGGMDEAPAARQMISGYSF